ncbi:flagellin, partial [Campylobacter jejuni]|uniref:flagellin n=1 Tax=Campylobacter jejuni TaxID=197 RepID=UPI003A80BC89
QAEDGIRDSTDSLVGSEMCIRDRDIAETAITNLDQIRADIGSVQNQVTSTINNITVTQVNVKAAESQIRDVDFAAESANYSKANILAQSGSYAMAQANSVQQNVLRLLQ